MQAAKRTLGSEQHASSKPLAFGDKSEFARDLDAYVSLFTALGPVSSRFRRQP